MKKYGITVFYKEKKYSHSITESWSGLSERAMIKVLNNDVFDLQFGSDNRPFEPNIELLRSSLGRYVDEKFIVSEFGRMKKAYKTYNKLISDISNISTGTTEVKLDPRTTVKITAADER